MGYTLVLGCGMIAFGPSLALWTLVVGRRPALVIIGIVSAFFWLLSVALASLLWSLLPAGKTVWFLTMTTSVILQGFGRLALAKTYMKTEKVINEAHTASGGNDVDGRRSGGGDDGRGWGSDTALLSERQREQQPPSSLKLHGLSSAIAAGVGWGAIHAVVMVGTALTKHTGPGAAYSQACPWIPSVIVTALNAQAFVVLDLLLMAAAFASVRSGDATLMPCSFKMHFFAALPTVFNFIEGGCAASLPLLYGVVALSVIASTRYGVLKLVTPPTRRRH